jgi:hypothetical protein
VVNAAGGAEGNATDHLLTTATTRPGYGSLLMTARLNHGHRCHPTT